MARITQNERNFWLNYFRRKIQNEIFNYESEHGEFLQKELKVKAEAKACKNLGIDNLLKQWNNVGDEIKSREDAWNKKRSAESKEFQKTLDPLIKKRDKLYARRMVKVVGGTLEDFKHGHNNGGRHNSPYTYDNAIKVEVNKVYDEMYARSAVGRKLNKMRQQQEDVPVALMIATSRIEMARAVRHMADALGIDLPETAL